MEKEWFKHYFSGVALDIWLDAITPEQTRAEVDFMLEELQLLPGSRVLDVPCGNGRHMTEFLFRGYSAAGVDISEELIALAQRTAVENNLQLDITLGDMRQLPWEGAFDGGYCFGNCFGYFNQQGMSEFLAAVSRALKPGARFLLDTAMTAESVLPALEDHLWWQVNDIHVLINNTYFPEDSRLDIEQKFFRPGSNKVETRLLSHWIYTAGEILRMLETAGLQPLAAYSSLDRLPFSLNSPYLIITAEKKLEDSSRQS